MRTVPIRIPQKIPVMNLPTQRSLRRPAAHARIARGLVAVVALIAAQVWAPQAQAQAVNLYTTREPALMRPLIEAFTAKSGIKVNTVFFKDGLLERVKSEGAASPADVLMTADIGNVVDLATNGLLQPIRSAEIESAVPPTLRSPEGTWFALSLRDRVVYANPATAPASLTYEDLAKPEWKGKVCIRSGQHPYNVALVASMIQHNGIAATEAWLRGVKRNLARRPGGGDRDVARDILGGLCEIGIANAYYAGQMKSAGQGTQARQWGDAIKVIRPTFEKTGGTFVNVTAAGIAAHAPNKARAIALLEFLVSDAGQRLYTGIDFEYPVRAGVPLSPVMEAFGPLVPDDTPLETIAAQRVVASRLIDRVGFDQ